LAPKQSKGVTQSVEVWHTADKTKKVEAIKLRWRLAYKLGGETKMETGEVPEFTIA
jgi:ADP-ribosylation factor-binding protein GGA